MKQKFPFVLLIFLQIYGHSTQLLAQVLEDTIRAKTIEDLATKCLDLRFTVKAARPYLDSLEEIRNRYPGQDSLPYADWLHQEARYSYFTGDPNTGIKQILKVLQVRKNSKKYGPNSAIVAYTYNLLGLLLGMAGRHDLALANHMAALKIKEDFVKKGGKLHYKNLLATSYANVGQELGYLGENDQSIAYTLRALPEIRDSAQKHPILRGFLPALYSNLGANYFQTHDHVLADNYFKLALQLLNSQLTSNEKDETGFLSQIWVNRGSNYLFQLKPDSANLCFAKAKRLLGEFNSGQAAQSTIAAMNQTEGLVNLYMGDFRPGVSKLNEALRVLTHNSTPIKDSVVISGIYYNLGVAFFMQNQPDSVAKYSASALNFLGPNPIERSFLDFAKVKGLMGRAWVQKYQNKGKKDVDLLEKATAEAKTVELAFDQYVTSLEGELRFFNLAAGLKIAFEPALAANLHWYDFDGQQKHLEEAFRLSEKTKALGWLEKFRFQRQFKSDPNALPEQRFRQDITRLKTLRYSILSQNGGTATAESEAIDQKIFELGRDHNTYVESLKKSNVALSNALYNIQVDSLPTVQQNLGPDETMLSYFAGDSSLFIFCVKKDKIWIRTLPHTALSNSVSTFTRALHCEGIPETPDIQDYITEAKYLYSQLIAPVDSLLKNSNRLIIIPDGILCAIPFEALCKEGSMESYPNWDFFLNHHSIRYGYSATALREMTQKQHSRKPDKPFLGVAPVFTGDPTSKRSVSLHENPVNSTLGPLAFNISEVRHVWETMGKSGDTLIGQAATKSAFLAQADRYQTILLSTHGAFNDLVVDHSFVAFTEYPTGDKASSYLLMPEVELMALNCDLLALSACQTAQGHLRKGEGVISLSRMFAFAGAKSLLSTLWKVGDKASMEIIESFFKYLADGQPKDEALQKAKIEFLTKDPDEKKFPSYWAPYILMGDPTPLAMPKRK